MTDQIRDGVIRLAHAVARAGLVIAAGGNIAGRVGADQLWVTPTGWNLADLSTDDLVLVSADGDHLEGANRATSELLLHVAAMRVRPDIAWSVHLHPPVATLLQALDVEIRAITTDHAFYLRRRLTNKAGAHLDLLGVRGAPQKQTQTAQDQAQ